ncbi:MAG: ATP-binding cassette domain-containing protein [Bacteroidia bacterium]|nr:ATP-binding cassette domain-containing protein [Bacteroidia bacterium]
MNLLEIKNLTKTYTGYKALDNVSLSVEKGSIYGLLGPNGAGKTTLIRIINQISVPDSGVVFFENEPLNTNHIYQIGYLPEERGLYKKQSVWEQIIYFGQLKGLSTKEAKLRAAKWLKKLELADWRNKKTEDLSKGMQQKVQFIITVIHNPKLLILDEPFTGFDPINADIIKNEIRELNINGTTILYSTHRMESVEEICDNICLINKSKKILDGNVKEIKKLNSKNQFEVIFDGKTPEWINMISTEKTEENYTKLLFSVSEMNRAEIIRKIANEVDIWQLKEIVPSIHQIFIEKVKEVNNA